VPSSYASYQVSDRLWVGLSVNGPFGLVTKADPFYAGQIYGRSSRLFTLNATPTIGVKLTDWLSIGAGVQIQYIDVNLAQAVPAPIGLSAFQTAALLRGGATAAQISQINTSLAGLSAVSLLAPTGRIEGDDVGVGYTLGMTLTPVAGTEIGVGFRSSIHHEVQGSISPALGLTEPVRAPVNLPEIVTVGLSQQIGAQFKLLAGYEFTNWSRIKDVPIVNRLDGTIPTTLNFRYRDGHFALTELTCAAEGGGAICRIGAPQGDVSVIPQGRRHTLRVRVPRKPLEVEIAGAGRIAEIGRPEGVAPDAPAWWMDDEAFAVVRLPPGAREARLAWGDA